MGGWEDARKKDGWMDGWIVRRMDGWEDGRKKDGWMDR